MNFGELGLIEPLARAVADEGYTTPTAIQAKAIPHILERSDILGCAQTGTGKTAAFALPVLQRLSKANVPKKRPGGQPRCLVLAPTRELAQQILDSFETYGRHLKLSCVSVFGGVSQGNQVKGLKKGVDIVVATPGRLLDLMQQGHLFLDKVEVLILDEADRMLDMGFIPDIRRIVKMVPRKRQTLLFSATIPNSIRSLADDLMRDAVEVHVDVETITPDMIDHSVYFVSRELKPALLAHLVDELDMERVLVFTRTKRGADRLVDQLSHRDLDAISIHGDKPQKLRQKALDRFRDNRVSLLIATDVMARGIDVDGITHVVNYDLSAEAETYVHRIGRTARAGATGTAVSFCDHSEIRQLEAVERLLGRRIPLQPMPDLSGSGEGGNESGSRRSESRPSKVERTQESASFESFAETATETATATRRPHKRRPRRHTASRKSRIR